MFGEEIIIERTTKDSFSEDMFTLYRTAFTPTREPPDRDSVHTYMKGRRFRRDFCNGAKLRPTDLESGLSVPIG